MDSPPLFKADIPLVRVNSTSMAKYPPSYNTEYSQRSPFGDCETLSDVASIITPFLEGKKFYPTSFLQIQSPGKGPISFPTPAKELQIPIFSRNTELPIYLSIRPKRGSGNCRLVNVENDVESTIARTTYWFGPGRSPRVRIGSDDDIHADVFNLDGKSILKRSVVFESRKWGNFEWRYARKNERNAEGEQIHNLLVLEKILHTEGKNTKCVRVAQLVRSEQTRTPGTKAMDAGNGGSLQMCLGGDDDPSSLLIDEVTVVVTCLVMLKKEIDRLRTVQIMVISGAGS